MDIDNGSVALEITPSPSSPAPAYSLASGEQHPAAAVNAPTTDQIIEVVAEVIEEAVEVIAEGKKHTFRRKKPKNATKKGGLQPVPFSQLYRYATTWEIVFMYIGMIFSGIAGACFPVTTIVFGQILDTFTEFSIAKSVLQSISTNATVLALSTSSNATIAKTYSALIANASSNYTIATNNLVSSVNLNTLYFLYLGIATFVLTYLFMAIFVSIGENITHRVREKYLQAVMRQNIGWFDEEGAGEVTTRISSDTLLVQDAISDKVPLCFSQIATVLAGFIIAFIKCWQLTLVLMVVFPVIAMAAVSTNILASRFQVKILSLYGNAGSYAEESISSVRTVVAFNGQHKMTTRYTKELLGARIMGLKKASTTGFGVGFLFFIIYLGYSLAFYYGPELLNWGLATGGVIVNVFFAVLIGAFAIGNIAPDFQAFALGRSAAAKIYQTIDRVPSIDTESVSGIKLKPEDTTGHIIFKNAKFTYPARKDVPILAGVNLDISPGKTLALVGASGSGKSTIIQLIERFYDCDEGEVILDGENIKNLNLIWYRQQIGLVSQEPTLFEGTIYSNVAHGLIGSSFEGETEDRKRELVEKACVKANAHEFILKLPQKYNTPTGERGLLLSGGQKQRIAIARAIVKDPKILLLDEATSALDTTSERVVQDALDRASKGRTTVAIAHRLSTIRNAETIVVMNKGTVIEAGTHDSLIALNGAYKKLVEAQHLDQKNESLANSPKKLDDQLKKEAVTLQAAASSNQELDDTRDVESAGEERKNASMVSIFRKILVLNYPELKFMIPGLCFAIGAGLVYPFFAIVFGNIIGVFYLKGDDLLNQAHFWALMFVVIAIATLICNFGMNTLFGYASEYMTERVRGLTFAAIMKQDICFFDDRKHSTGILTSNLSSDATKIQGISGMTLGTILSVTVNLTGGAVVALVYGWKLALVALTCLPFLVFCGYFRLRIITYFTDKNKGAYERSAQIACEAVAAIRTVQSLTREKDVMNEYMKILEKPLKDGYKNAWINTILYAISSSANFLVNALVFWYGGQLIAYNDYSQTQMFTVFVAVVFGSMGAGRIFAYAPDIKKAQEAAENVLGLLASKPILDFTSNEGDMLPKGVDGLIEFQNVKFRYPTRPHVPVLQDLTITVKPGQFAALVGPSGCGKSTTIGLMERFYDPLAGTVKVDGKDISSLNLTAYRMQIGLVSQEPNLFDMSIKDNIGFGFDQPPSQELVEKAAKDANIHDFIVSLPQGYDTKVGSKGGQLSGGQKQRIAIARALIRNPKILLLDEATSALDAESEKVVQEALNNASKGRTTVAVAHRLSTIQHADIIYVIKDGKVFESGNHQQLLETRGLYFELVQQQDLEKKK